MRTFGTLERGCVLSSHRIWCIIRSISGRCCCSGNWLGLSEDITEIINFVNSWASALFYCYYYCWWSYCSYCYYYCKAM